VLRKAIVVLEANDELGTFESRKKLRTGSLLDILLSQLLAHEAFFMAVPHVLEQLVRAKEGDMTELAVNLWSARRRGLPNSPRKRDVAHPMF
jgi:hypothetical protein